VHLPQRVRDLLSAQGLEWPGAIEAFDVLASTNDLAKEKARAGAPEWTAILAGEQTHGRGRHGHGWVSTPGNLFLSLILRPRVPPREASLIPLAAGVGLAEAVADLGVEARLKWPNDVMAGGRKLAGILVEGSGLGEPQPSVVVGVGLNLSPSLEEVPPELRESIGSIGALTQDVPGVDEAAAAVLRRLALWYHALGREGAPAVMAAWRRWSLDWWGQSVTVRSGEDVVAGILRGVDDRGALLLLRDDGTEVALFSGEVSGLRLQQKGT
jgi:BirA family biotin operon repressor/biotin-[acetyl-CoA-carboxylase] ligase